jgi:hypothetical protein
MLIKMDKIMWNYLHFIWKKINFAPLITYKLRCFVLNEKTFI